jgi:ferrous iron transport protein B
MTAAPPSTKTLTIALIGNPNTGKSTLFNALSGFRALTGNYPGVTVEKKIGRMNCGETRADLIDLPGTYSLAPRTLDEMVTVDVLLGRQRDVGAPDAVVCIVDASNIERNLYLVSQVLDLELPTVLVLNMSDVARTRGIVIDEQALALRLKIPVVKTEAHRKQGIQEVKQAILEAVAKGRGERPRVFPAEFTRECDALQERLAAWGRPETPYYLVERLLLDTGGWLEGHFFDGQSQPLAEHLALARARLAECGCKTPAIEARTRYRWVAEILEGIVTQPPSRPATFSDRLDRLLTHRVLGLLVFLALMFVIFQAIYAWAKPLMDLCEKGQQKLGDVVGALLPAGPLQSLVVDGVIGGVGAVLIFLPQIVILFLFVAILEDCGYMARAAFIMDKLMTRVGLSGKSFIPLMSSFACAVPGIMATRVIENRRDRLTTILVAPLMSCSARQPVYILMSASFIPASTYLGGWIELQALVMFGMTFLGAAIAVPIAWLFKKTFFRGETPPFVMELPTYKIPSLRVVFHRVYESSWAFVARAGTLIFATTILVWAAGYFPGDHAPADTLQAQIEELQAQLGTHEDGATELQKEIDRLSADKLKAQIEKLQAQLSTQKDLAAELREEIGRRSSEQNKLQSALQEKSLLGQFGHFIEPAVKPLGWDWRIGVGVIASFPAREVIIGTLGTIYSLGPTDDSDTKGLQSALQAARWPDGRKVYNVPVALSIMVFFALCAQCASTLMVIRRETNGWLWPIFTFSYMTVLAYAGAFLVYRIGMALGL